MQVLVTCTPLCRKVVAVFFRVLPCQAQWWGGPGRAQHLLHRSEGADVLRRGGLKRLALGAGGVEQPAAGCMMHSLTMSAEE